VQGAQHALVLTSGAWTQSQSAKHITTELFGVCRMLECSTQEVSQRQGPGTDKGTARRLSVMHCPASPGDRP